MSFKSGLRTPGSHCIAFLKSRFSIPPFPEVLAPACLCYNFWSLDGFTVFEHLNSTAESFDAEAEFFIWCFKTSC